MKSKKTVPIDLLLEKANLILSCEESTISDTLTKEYKQAICDMIEIALHAANRYKGFMYLGDGNKIVFNSLEYWTRKYF